MSADLETKSARGMFGPVSGPDGGTLDARSVEYKEGGRSKQLVDPDELPAEYKQAVEADDFVIYGKASVEQYDEDGQRVDIDALQKSIDQLFNSGNISRRHKDVRVGEPLPEWELEEDKELVIGDERFEFQAGDTLATGANPDVVQERRGGERDEDEFWIVANLWADTEIGKDTRLRVLSGDLNGFSVTIYAKETQPTAKGEDVTDVDFHAVTIGSDEAIKNKESRFGLADFKALFDGVLGGTDDGAAGGRATRPTRPSVGGQLMFRNLLKKSADETGFNGELLSKASEAAEKAQDDDVSLKEAAEEVTPSGAGFKADDVENAVSVLQADHKAASDDDLEEILVGVEGGDLSAEEALELIDQAGPEPDVEDEGPGEELDDEPPEAPDEEPEEMADTETKEEEEADEDDPSYDEEELEAKLDEKLEEKGLVTEDTLEEKLDEQRETLINTVATKLEDGIPSADEIASKMDTGATDSPSAGSGSDSRDYTAEMKSAYGQEGEGE